MVRYLTILASLILTTGCKLTPSQTYSDSLTVQNQEAHHIRTVEFVFDDLAGGTSRIKSSFERSESDCIVNGPWKIRGALVPNSGLDKKHVILSSIQQIIPNTEQLGSSTSLSANCQNLIGKRGYLFSPHIFPTSTAEFFKSYFETNIPSIIMATYDFKSALRLAGTLDRNTPGYDSRPAAVTDCISKGCTTCGYRKTGAQSYGACWSCVYEAVTSVFGSSSANEAGSAKVANLYQPHFQDVSKYVGCNGANMVMPKGLQWNHGAFGHIEVKGWNKFCSDYCGIAADLSGNFSCKRVWIPVTTNPTTDL